MAGPVAREARAELLEGGGRLEDLVEGGRSERHLAGAGGGDEDFLGALAAMPPASGCALGFDRLVMLATGARHIDDVLWTPPP